MNLLLNQLLLMSQYKRNTKIIHNNLRVLYWNACTFNYLKWNQLHSHLNQRYDNDPNNITHVICISEAKLTNSSLQTTESLRGKFGSYIRYYYPCELDSNANSANGGGLLLYVHQSLHVSSADKLCLSITHPSLPPKDKFSTDIRWIQFEFGIKTTFTLGLIYLHPSASFQAVQCCINNIKHCMNNTNGPILIAGDFNLKHPLWSKHYGQTVDKSAECLVEFMDEEDLTLLNLIYNKHEVTLQPFATLRSEPSTVDLAITNRPKIISEMNILTHSELLSDHNPLDIYITNHSIHQNQNQQINNKKQEKWRSIDLDEVQWELFEKHLTPYLTRWKQKYEQLLLPSSICSLALLTDKNYIQNLLDDATFELSTIIVKSAEHVIGKKVIGKQYKKCFSTHADIIQELLVDSHNARDRYYDLVKSAKHSDQITIEQQLSAKKEWKLYVKRFNDKLCEITRDEWLEKLDSVYKHERAEKQLSWSHYKLTIPSATQWTSKINNHINNEPPANADIGNDNLAQYFASICQSNPATQLDRDPAIVQSVQGFDMKLKEEWTNMIKTCNDDANPQNGVISLEEISDFCRKINCKKAYGCDEIDGYMLKYGGLYLHSCLQLLFNSCWCTGVLPINFTSSNVFPLYKKGDIHQASSYRPISLTSCLMRLFERILYSRVESQIMLHPSQSGFRKYHSTEDNLYRLLERVYEAMWSSSNTYGVCLPIIFLDLQKAFDKMDIPSALYKLHQTGLELNSRMLHFFSAFLSNRYMRTVSLQCVSDWYEIDTGAPQGTIFGPLIFAVYINDLITELENRGNIMPNVLGQHKSGCESPAFADDIVLIPRALNQPMSGARGDVEAAALLQSKLHSLSLALKICGNWARNWCMSFSKEKTNLLIFRKHQNLIHSNQSKSEKIIESLLKSTSLQLIQSNQAITTANFTIQLVDQYKYMGITLNGNVGRLFEHHIDDILGKIRTRCYQVKRVLKDSMPVPVALMFVRAMVHSVYSYGFAFIRLKKSEMTKIYSSLRGVWRAILKLPSFTSTVDLMLELNIIPLHIQHQQHLMRFMYGLTKKPDHHLVKRLFAQYRQAAVNKGALTKTRECHPYHARPIALEHRELLGTWKTDHVTQHNPIIWPANPSSKKQINSVASHAALVHLSSQRTPTTGLSSIKLLPEEIVKVQNFLTAVAAQQRNEEQRKLMMSESHKKAHSLLTKKPMLHPNQSSLSIDASIVDSYLLNKTSFLRNEPFMKIDLPILSRMRSQLRVDRAPTYSVIEKYCVTEPEKLIIRPYINRCRGCEQLIDETREHILLDCPRHSVARQALITKLQSGGSPQLNTLIEANQPLLQLSIPLILGQIHLLPKKLVKPVLNWTGDFIQEVYNKHPLPFINKNFISVLGDLVSKLLRPP
jgi:hypothetical protein